MFVGANSVIGTVITACCWADIFNYAPVDLLRPMKAGLSSRKRKTSCVCSYRATDNPVEAEKEDI